ncbi:isoamylase early set domain-containing protein [Aeromonas caviae]|uniref:isoamylase early set domain-containing protein n=1 Tax=Aeromonas caviae TaxID=648 RepID=UPI000855D61B|nr:isoamylase early set domain-containing protein [Aeromonas caviae]OCW45532.1 1,4-alpha-glucan branching protein [Aeromonas caviae]WGY74888.1 isoamylase early set domain-containing protein [Aeromonas caviae]BBT68076.1 1,4-alpha-glucan-branching protein [Aeromonas caviae]
MPINKQFLKSRPEVKVNFAVEKEAAGDAEQVLLLGEFSQWQPIELKRMKNGEFKATLNLPTDGPSHFEYCYQLVQPDGETLYDNDWEADDYVPGPFGRDNSVVRVSQPG